MSCPDCAEASAAARAGTSCTGMWSTVTAILFLSPQSLANLSNQVSNAGTKWLHCTIVSDLLSANARDTNGAERPGASQAAPPTAPEALRKLPRVTEQLCLFPPDPIALLLC